MATQPGNVLDEASIKRLENSVIYALAASSSKLKVPPGTRIWDLYERTLSDLFITIARREWMWGHINYGVTLIGGAKRIDGASASAKGAKTVKDVWTVVLAAQPGSPAPEEKPTT